MKIKQLIIALVILAALGGAYYFVQKQPAATDPNAVVREDVFSFKPEAVQEFSLNVSGQPAATFRRKPAPAAKPGDKTAPAAQWEIVAPAGVEPDSQQIQSFVEELASFKANPLGGGDAAGAPAAAPAWADYGLDQPERSFKFQLQDGKSLTLDIGKLNPTGYARYARRNDAAPVLLLDTADNKSLLEKTLFDLRDKRIFPRDINAATRIDLNFRLAGSPSAAEVAKARSLGLPVRPERISFIRDSGGNWKLTDPALRTDVGGATYLATIIGGGQMQAVVEEQAGSLAPYGLDKPQIRVQITSPAPSGSGTTKDELLVGDMMKKGDLEFFYAKSSLRPQVFTILRVVYDQLNQDLEYYRNRYLYDFEVGQPNSLELSGPAVASYAGGAALRFDRRGENWVRLGSMPGAKESPMKESQVENFLSAVRSVRISSYPSDEPDKYAAYGLDKPWLTMKVTFGQDNRQETVIYARKGDKFYAARKGEPSVYEMSSAEPASMESRLKELTDTSAKPTSVAPSAVGTAPIPN
jgi:hypothetical protein